MHGGRAAVDYSVLHMDFEFDPGGAVASLSEAEAAHYRALLADAVDHVQNHAAMTSLIEVQTVPRDDVEQVVVRESAIGRRVHVIARHETFRLAARRAEDAGVGVVAAVGQEL